MLSVLACITESSMFAFLQATPLPQWVTPLQYQRACCLTGALARLPPFLTIHSPERHAAATWKGAAVPRWCQSRCATMLGRRAVTSMTASV